MHIRSSVLVHGASFGISAWTCVVDWNVTCVSSCGFQFKKHLKGLPFHTPQPPCLSPACAWAGGQSSPFFSMNSNQAWLRPLSPTSGPGLQSSGILLLFHFQCEDINQSFPSEVGRPTRQASSVRNRVTLSKSFNIPKSFRVPEPWFSTCSLKDQPCLLQRVTVRMKYNMHFVGCRTLPGIHSLYSFNAWLCFAIKYWVIFGLLIVS